MPNIAIVGCGLIGQEHTRCLSTLGSPPQLFFDADFERATALAASVGGEAVRSYEEIVHDPSVDAVYICTYHDTHAPYALHAARHGKHIFLEKPMAITEEDCVAIVEAVQSARVLCMTGFKFHYTTIARQAAEMLITPLVIVANIFDKRWADDIWANDPKRGGGNVLSQGCHAVELMMMLARSAPQMVVAMGGNLHHPGVEITDAIAASLRFESGAIGSLTVSDTGEMPHNSKFLIRASDGKRTIELYDRLARLVYFDGVAVHDMNAPEDGFLNENREFLTALKEERTPETNEATGLAVQRVLFKMIESAKTGRPCQI
jgi:predicted dehydrogenase